MFKILCLRFVMMLCLLVFCVDANAEVNQAAIDKKVSEFRIHIAKGNVESALKAAKELREMAPESADNYAVEGFLALSSKQVEVAVSKFEAALKLQKNHPIAASSLARIKIQSKKVAEGEKLIQEALKAHPFSVDVLAIKAELEIAKRDFNSAIESYKKVASNKNENVEIRGIAYFKIAEIYAHTKDVVNAEAYVRKSLEMNWTPQVALGLGNLLTNSKKPLEGRKVYETIEKRIKEVKFRAKATQVKKALQVAKLKNNVVYVKLQISREVYPFPEVTRLFLEIRKELTGFKSPEVPKMLKEIDTMELSHFYNELKESKKNKASAQVLQNLADKILKLAPQTNNVSKNKIIAFAKEVKKGGIENDDETLRMILDLAKKGRRLDFFIHPHVLNQPILKGMGIYGKVDKVAREKLSKYYTEKEKERKVPAYGKILIKYIDDPSNVKLKEELAVSYYNHIKSIKVEDSEQFEEAVYPRKYWAKAPRVINAVAGNEKYEKQYRGAQTRYKNGVQSVLFSNGKWKDLIKTIDLATNNYPYYVAMQKRGDANFSAGNYKAAFEDYAVASAMVAWKRAENYKETMVSYSRTNVRLVIRTKELHALANNEKSQQEVKQVLEHAKNNQWTKVVPFFTKKHDGKSIAYLASRQLIKDNSSWSVGVTNALSEALWEKKGAAKEEFYKSLDSHVYTISQGAVYRLKDTKTDKEKIERILNDLKGKLYRSDDKFLHFALAELYEKGGKKQIARLHYNVAANGLVSSKLSGLAKLAAQRRNKLEGKKTKQQNLQMCSDDDKFLLKQDIKQTNVIVFSSLRAALYSRMLLFGGKKDLIIAYRGYFHRLAKLHKKALNDFTISKPLKGNEKVHDLYLGELHRFCGDIPKAKLYLKKAYANKFRSTFVLHSLASITLSEGAIEEALGFLSESIQKTKNDTYSLRVRSEIYEYILSDDDKAMKDIDAVIAINVEKAKTTKFAFDPNLRYYRRKEDILLRKINKSFENLK